ncbi:MAG: 3-dehydroquinate synthase, partial [Cyclobacteriaceae bacterium]
DYIHFTVDPTATLTEIIQDERPDKVALLVDENTKSLCLPLLGSFHADLMIEIESGEKNKNLNTCQIIWQELTNAGFSRKSILVNLGGGVIGDMGGFCASTFKRGIRFINIPTTLLAAVDANIGGKLGIDFMGFKNHIGVFNDPTAVIVSDKFLSTLPKRELRSGYAEVIKHGLIADDKYFDQLRDSTFPAMDWQEIIRHSIGIKGSVVAEDPLEKGKRKILNFGHTLGHAIETYYLNNQKSLLHGEAIACGMILEAHISYQQNLISKISLEIICDYLSSIYEPVLIPTISEINELMIHDKKNVGLTINFSLINAIGSCLFDQQVSDKMIVEAVHFYENLK